MEASTTRALCVWLLALAACATACADPDVTGSEGSGQPVRADGSVDAALRDADSPQAGEAGLHDVAAPDAARPPAPTDAAPASSADAGRADATAQATADASLDAAAPASRDGAADAPDAGVAELKPLTIFLAGDSTVASYRDTGSERDQAGWGQLLSPNFIERVKVDNRAVGGATSRHFIEDGRLDAIVTALRAGDVLLVQFGTNDGNKTATYELNGKIIPYYLDPATSFRTYLTQYVERARGAGATPIFVTPPPRNSAYCVGGNGTGAHAQAMRELGVSLNVPVVDLNKKAADYLTAICPAPTPEDFFLLRSDGRVDGTHFQKHGARVLAGFVAEEMRAAKLALAAYLRAAGP
jgi:lysophospholipase L1-like esterase